MSSVIPQTVAEWEARGYRGLRIPRCHACHVSTWASWRQLAAMADESVTSVAARMRCASCGQAPPGLAVVASASPLLH